MTEPQPSLTLLPNTTLAPARRTELEARRDREAAALRANLLRRKQQQRARAEAEPAPAADDATCR